MLGFKCIRSWPILLCRFQIAESIRKYHVTTKRTKDTKVSEILHFNFLTRSLLWLLRDLRGENVCFDFG